MNKYHPAYNVVNKSTKERNSNNNIVATRPEKEKLTQRENKKEENNPYLFESQRFDSPFRISHGDLRLVEKFTERSQLLSGIEKYRVAFLELEPQTFMLPHHCDSEAIFFIVRGNLILLYFNICDILSSLESFLVHPKKNLRNVSFSYLTTI